MKVQLTFKPKVRKIAWDAMVARGIAHRLAYSEWFGPTFDNVEPDGMNVTDLPGFLMICIGGSDDPVYYYPVGDIARIKVFDF